MGSRVIPSSHRMMSLNPLLAIMFMLYTLSLGSCSWSIASLVVVYFSERETWQTLESLPSGMHGRDNKKAGSMGCRTPQPFCGRFNFCVPVIRMLVRLTFRGTRVAQWCEHFLPTIVFLVLVLTPYVGWVFCQRGSSFALRGFWPGTSVFPFLPN